MTEPKPKKKMGRPLAKIDQITFENMCSIFCTLSEICEVFNVTPKTLYRWVRDTYNDTFSNIYDIHSSKGKMSLRRAQFKLAQTNPQMAIWLGKNILGQSDKETNKETDIKGGIQIVIKDQKDEERLDKIEAEIETQINRR